MRIKRQDLFYLFCILVLALILRGWGIAFGLPLFHHMDEPKYIYTTLYAGTNLLKPDTFFHSTLIPYMLVVPYAAYFVLGKMIGVFNTPFELYVKYLSDPSPFLLLGRLMTLIISVWSVHVVFKIGRILGSVKVGLLAALLFATTFLVAKESHYIRDDILATFCILFYFYVFLGWQRKTSFKNAVILGIWLGLTIGAKFIYFMIVSQLFFSFKSRWKSITAILASAIIIYFITNPYALLQSKIFLESLFELSTSMRGIGTSTLDGKSVWWRLLEHLFFGMGFSMFTFSILSLIFLLLGKQRNRQFSLIVMVCLLYLSIGISGGNFARWVIPIIPFLCLISALTCSYVFNKLRVVQWVFLIFLIVPTLLQVMKFDAMLTWENTRNLSTLWIEQNIPPESEIVVEHLALGPDVRLSQSRLAEIIKTVQEKGQPAYTYRAHYQSMKERKGYRRHDVYVIDSPGPDTKLMDVSYYLQRGIEYIVLVSWISRDLNVTNKVFYDSLISNYELIKTFVPTVEFEYDPHGWEMDHEALSKVSITDPGISGPTIRIFKLKSQL